MNRRILTILKILFFLSIGFFLIWLSLRDLDSEQREEILVSFKNANYSWVLLSIGAGALSHLFRAERWRLLMKPIGYSPKLHNTFFAVMIGYLANLALPRLGEVTRCGMLSKYEKIPINKSFGTVIAERSVDMIFFILLFFINLWIFWSQLSDYVREHFYGPVNERMLALGNSTVMLWTAGIIVIVLIGGFFIIRYYYREARFYLKIKSIVKGFIEGFKSVLRVKKIGFFLLYSVLIWVMYFFMVYVCFFALAETSGLGFGPGLAVLIFGSIGIMFSPGGIGAYPYLVQKTLAIYGIAKVNGIALGWITWTAQNLMIVILGILSLVLLPILTRKRYHEFTTEKVKEKSPQLESSTRKSCRVKSKA